MSDIDVKDLSLSERETLEDVIIKLYKESISHTHEKKSKKPVMQ